jgi:hypothetical protein
MQTADTVTLCLSVPDAKRVLIAIRQQGAIDRLLAERTGSTVHAQWADANAVIADQLDAAIREVLS